MSAGSRAVFPLEDAWYDAETAAGKHVDYGMQEQGPYADTASWLRHFPQAMAASGRGRPGELLTYHRESARKLAIAGMPLAKPKIVAKGSSDGNDEGSTSVGIQTRGRRAEVAMWDALGSVASTRLGETHSQASASAAVSRISTGDDNVDAAVMRNLARVARAAAVLRETRALQAENTLVDADPTLPVQVVAGNTPLVISSPPGSLGQLAKMSPGGAWKAAELIRSAADEVIDPPGFSVRRQPLESQGGDLLVGAAQLPSVVAAGPDPLVIAWTPTSPVSSSVRSERQSMFAPPAARSRLASFL